MAEYGKIAAIHILVGFEMMVLGFLNMNTSDDTVEALLIMAFLLYLTSVILTVMALQGDGNMIINIINLICVLVAAVFVITGSAIWYDNNNGNNNSSEPYVMTLDMTGGILAAIGGIFLIVQLVTGGSVGQSPA